MSYRKLGLMLLLLLVLPQIVAAESHRRATTPTAYWWYYGGTEAVLNDIVDTEGARIIDIEVDNTSPMRFSASFVHNSGDYATGWWWYYNATIADINTLLDQNNARLIDIERYVTATGGVRYACVMVDNTGPHNKDSWYFVGMEGADIAAYVNTYNARLVDIESWDEGGTRRYGVIMISNTGADASGWWYYYNVSPSTITTHIQDNNSRVLEYNVASASPLRVDAILMPNSGAAAVNWWWYYGATAADVSALLSQNGARPTDIDRYWSGGQQYFSVVMINNSNELTTSMGNAMAWGADGATGFYLREIGGPTLASLQPDFVFEPASTIKVIHHLHAMRQVEAGADDLGAILAVNEGMTGTCPTDTPPVDNQTLAETLQGMMQQSSNTDTRAIQLRFGEAAIVSTAVNVAGMTSTDLNHTIGCGEQMFVNHNELTLRDAGRLYEGVHDGTLLGDAAREDFYGLMLSDTAVNPGWFANDLEDVVYEEAANLGIPNAASSYWTNVRLAWKAGDYSWNPGTPHEWRSVAGFVELPQCDHFPSLVYKSYVFGLFVDDAVDHDYADDRLDLTAEMFREIVREGLLSCPSAVDDIPEVARDGSLLRSVYPNPFNPSTTITFDMPKTTHARLSVHDLRGAEVAVLIDGVRGIGAHSQAWNGTDKAGLPVPSGVYFVQLKAGDRVETQKIALIE